MPRLRHEAEMLDLARHPGVVELLDVQWGERAASLRMAAAGPSLAERRPEDASALAAVVSLLASTVADLHALGVVHGAIEPSHVVLDGAGRPLLCGFGDATRAPEGSLAAADDVAALGRLTQTLLDRLSSPHRSERGAEILAALAAWAAAGSAGERPSARQLADAVAERVPAARLVPPERRLPSAPPVAAPGLVAMLRRRPRVVVGGLTAVAVAGAGALVAFVGRQPPPRPTSPGDHRAVAAARPRPPGAMPAPPVEGGLRPRVKRVWPERGVTRSFGAATDARSCPSVTASLRADVDGDGCEEALEFEAGVLRAGSARWSIGEPGDLVVTGRWACPSAAKATLAVRRARDGSVWVFDRWPDAVGATAPAAFWGTVAGDRLTAEDLDGDGCDEVVAHGQGRPSVLRRPGTGEGAR